MTPIAQVLLWVWVHALATVACVVVLFWQIGDPFIPITTRGCLGIGVMYMLAATILESERGMACRPTITSRYRHTRDNPGGWWLLLDDIAILTTTVLAIYVVRTFSPVVPLGWAVMPITVMGMAHLHAMYVYHTKYTTLNGKWVDTMSTPLNDTLGRDTTLDDDDDDDTDTEIYSRGGGTPPPLDSKRVQRAVIAEDPFTIDDDPSSTNPFDTTS